MDWLALQCATWIVELLVLGALFWTRMILGTADADAGFWSTFSSFEAQIIEGALYLLLSVPYYVWATARFGTTLGKWPLGLYIVDFRGDARGLKPVTLRQSFARWAGYLASYLPLGTGFLMAAFHPEKRAMHDLIAGTAVVRRARAPAQVLPTEG